MDRDNIKSVTLRIAIFFGLTTFALCIAIFYTESVLEEKRDMIEQRDSAIEFLHGQIDEQQTIIRGLEEETKSLKVRLDAMGSSESRSN